MVACKIGNNGVGTLRFRDREKYIFRRKIIHFVLETSPYKVETPLSVLNNLFFINSD